MSRLDVLRKFLLAEKPRWCLPVDIALTACLIAEDEYPGHEAIATHCGIHDVKAIMRSLKRLEAAGWIALKTNRYTDIQVRPEKLPK